MTFDQFKERIADACETHEAHGKTVRPTCRDEEVLRRAFAEYGDKTAHASFYLLTGRFV